MKPYAVTTTIYLHAEDEDEALEFVEGMLEEYEDISFVVEKAAEVEYEVKG